MPAQIMREESYIPAATNQCERQSEGLAAVGPHAGAAGPGVRVGARQDAVVHALVHEEGGGINLQALSYIRTPSNATTRTARMAQARKETKYEAPLDAAVSRWILGAMMAKNQCAPWPRLSPLHRAGKRLSSTAAGQTEAEAV
jgi:hypothetical protein